MGQGALQAIGERHQTVRSSPTEFGVGFDEDRSISWWIVHTSSVTDCGLRGQGQPSPHMNAPEREPFSGRHRRNSMTKYLFALSVTIATLTACGAEVSVPTTPSDSIVCGCDMPQQDRSDIDIVGDSVDADASVGGTNAADALPSFS